MYIIHHQRKYFTEHKRQPCMDVTGKFIKLTTTTTVLGYHLKSEKHCSVSVLNVGNAYYHSTDDIERFGIQ